VNKYEKKERDEKYNNEKILIHDMFTKKCIYIFILFIDVFCTRKISYQQYFLKNIKVYDIENCYQVIDTHEYVDFMGGHGSEFSKSNLYSILIYIN